MDALLMNPLTGCVAPESEWRLDFAAMSPLAREMFWGGPNFEDAGLVEVKWNRKNEQYEEVK